MKYPLRILLVLAAAQPAMAQQTLQDMSAIQQYLLNDTGYAPGVIAAPAALTPYDTASVPPAPAIEEDPYYAQEHLNEGVAGMNF